MPTKTVPFIDYRNLKNQSKQPVSKSVLIKKLFSITPTHGVFGAETDKFGKITQIPGDERASGKSFPQEKKFENTTLILKKIPAASRDFFIRISAEHSAEPTAFFPERLLSVLRSRFCIFPPTRFSRNREPAWTKDPHRQ